MTAQETFPSTYPSLLIAIRDRQDSAAWREFTDQYTEVLICFCRKRGLQLADAEDVAQKVLMAVSQQIPAFERRPDRGLFRSWLATIAIRAIWRHRKSLHCGLSSGDDRVSDLAEPACRSWVADFNEAVLETGLARIQGRYPAEEWSTFEKVWLRDEPCAVAAHSAGRPVSWVYRTKYRILKDLRQEVLALADESAVFSG